MPQVVDAQHYQLAGKVRRILSRLDKNADLVALGAYHAGADPALDACLRVERDLLQWLQQGTHEFYDVAEAMNALTERLQAESDLELA